MCRSAVQKKMCDHDRVSGTYVSEYEESVILQHDIWIESYQPQTGTGYFKTYRRCHKLIYKQIN